MQPGKLFHGEFLITTSSEYNREKVPNWTVNEWP